MTRAAERLIELLPGDSERAHAALLAALSLEMGGTDSEKYAAWKRARELQQKSVTAGQPGTPQQLFDWYIQNFAKTPKQRD